LIKNEFKSCGTHHPNQRPTLKNPENPENPENPDSKTIIQDKFQSTQHSTNPALLMRINGRLSIKLRDSSFHFVSIFM
jgi:hypothetical protein